MVQKETYLLELSRYVVLNPVRAMMAAVPGDWPWSSYRATVGETSASDWLNTDWLLRQFGDERAAAIDAYRQFVLTGVGRASPWQAIRHQVYLGDGSFVGKHKENQACGMMREIPKAQRKSMAFKLSAYQALYPKRVEAMAMAYLSCAYTMAEIGAYFGVHYMTVSRAVRAFTLKRSLNVGM